MRICCRGTGGVGSACVKSFHEAGANVVFSYNSNFEEAKKIEDVHSGVASIQLNLIDEDSVKNCLAKISKDHNGINTVVNAAGFNIPQKYISEIDSKLWRDVIESDINGFFNLVHHSLAELRASKGSIVFISSAGLFRYPPGDALSVAPKAAIEHLIKGIAKEEGINGVRANSIALGVIDAGIFHRLLNEENTFFDEAWHEAVLNNLALKDLDKLTKYLKQRYFWHHLKQLILRATVYQLTAVITYKLLNKIICIFNA